MLIKLDDAIAAVEAKKVNSTDHENCIYDEGLDEAIEALRALPTVSVTDGMCFNAGNVFHDALTAGKSAPEAMRAALEAALGATVSDGWEDMSSAPRDRTSILAIVAPNDSRHLEYHAGRMFVIRHEGVTDNGYDLGWAVFPGFGGAPDWYFAGWRPLPDPPSE